MISFHRNLENLGDGRFYGSGFETAHIVDVERISVAMARYAWSPIRWKDGIRREVNFLGSYFCVLDFDDGSLSLDQARRVWCDATHVIGTTKSHKVSKGGGVPVDRFRVLLYFGRLVDDLEVYRHTMQHYIDKYGADAACKDGARFFWPCKEIISVEPEGYAQDIVLPTAGRRKAPPHHPPTRYRDFGMVRRRTLAALRSPFPEREKNFHCFQTAKDLFEAGYGFDEIYAIIVNSPTYRGVVPTDLAREISDCIRSGIKSVKEGRAYGQRDGSRRGAGQAAAEEERPDPTGGTLPEHHHEDERRPDGSA